MTQPTNLSSLITSYVIPLINLAVAVLAAAALAIFMWGIVRYIMSSGSSSEKTNSRGMMIWGLVALVVLVSVWGIVRVVADAFFGAATTVSNSTYTPS